MPWPAADRWRAARHANVSIASGYLHVAVDDEGSVGNLLLRP